MDKLDLTARRSDLAFATLAEVWSASQIRPISSAVTWANLRKMRFGFHREKSLMSKGRVGFDWFSSDD